MSTVEEQVVAAQEYVMPEAQVGDQVLWYDRADQHHAPSFGFIIKTGTRSVEIVVYGTNEPVWKWSVRHMSDPQLKTNEHVRENGGWDFTPMWKRLRELETARLDALAGVPGNDNGRDYFEPPKKKPKTRGMGHRNKEYVSSFLREHGLFVEGEEYFTMYHKAKKAGMQ
jgi:hypothetical protein